MTNQDVCFRYTEGSFSSGKGSNIFFEHDTIYSYGYHFPMAIKLSATMFLVNGDSYSVTTRRHQGHLLHALGEANMDTPTISFTVLESAIGTNRLKGENIVDYTEGKSIALYRLRDPDDNRLLLRFACNNQSSDEEFIRPSQGMLIKDRPRVWDENGNIIKEYYSWHILGGVVFKYKINKRWRYFLCGLDENNYFISMLPKPASTVDEAYQLLKPQKIIYYESLGYQVQRQGEWFVPSVNLTDKELSAKLGYKTIKDMNKRVTIKSLPKQDNRSNEHVVKQIKHKGTTYVKGRMTHRDPILHNITGEHRSVIMKGWCPVFKNTERASWSVNGRFD